MIGTGAYNKIDARETFRRILLGKSLLSLREHCEISDWGEQLRHLGVSRSMAARLMHIAARFGDEECSVQLVALLKLNLPFTTYEELAKYEPDLIEAFLSCVQGREGLSIQDAKDIIRKLVSDATSASKDACISRKMSDIPGVTTEFYVQLRQIAIDLQRLSHSLIAITDFPQ